MFTKTQLVYRRAFLLNLMCRTAKFKAIAFFVSLYAITAVMPCYKKGILEKKKYETVILTQLSLSFFLFFVTNK